MLRSTTTVIDVEYWLISPEKAQLVVQNPFGIGAERGTPYIGEPELDLESFRGYCRIRDYGTRLFRSLFPESSALYRGYRSAIESMGNPKKFSLSLRFRLSPELPAELHAVKLESLYDPEEEIFLACWAHARFSRVVDGDVTSAPIIPFRPRVLIALADGNDLEKIHKLSHIDRELVAESFRDLSGRQLNCKWFEGPVTPQTLRDTLQAGGFHILHLVAHAGLSDKKPYILLQEPVRGLADRIDERRFASIFQDLPDLRLVTLMACRSGKPGEGARSGLVRRLVVEGMPAVLGFSETIGQHEASALSRVFYSHLCRHGLVDLAANLSRYELSLRGDSGQGPTYSEQVPTSTVLVTRGGGALWKPYRRPLVFGLIFALLILTASISTPVWDAYKNPVATPDRVVSAVGQWPSNVALSELPSEPLSSEIQDLLARARSYQALGGADNHKTSLKCYREALELLTRKQHAALDRKRLDRATKESPVNAVEIFRALFEDLQVR